MAPVIPQPVLVLAVALKSGQPRDSRVGQVAKPGHDGRHPVVSISDLAGLKVQLRGVLAVSVLVGQVETSQPLKGANGPGEGDEMPLELEATEGHQRIPGVHVAVTKGMDQLLQLGNAGAAHDGSGQHLKHPVVHLVAVQVAGAGLGHGVLDVLPQEQDRQDRQAPQERHPHETVALGRVGVRVAGDHPRLVGCSKDSQQAHGDGPTTGDLGHLLLASLPLDCQGGHLEGVIEGAGGEPEGEQRGVHRGPPVGNLLVEEVVLAPQAHHGLIDSPDPVVGVAGELAQLHTRRLLHPHLGRVLEGPQGCRGAKGGAASHVLLDHPVHHLLVGQPLAGDVHVVDPQLAIHGPQLHLLAVGLHIGLGGDDLIDRLLDLVLHPVVALRLGVEPQRHRLGPGLHLKVGHQVEQVLGLTKELVNRPLEPQGRPQRQIVPQLLELQPDPGVGLRAEQGDVGQEVLLGPLLPGISLDLCPHGGVVRHQLPVGVRVAAEPGLAVEVGLLQHLLQPCAGHAQGVPIRLGTDLGRLDQAQLLQAAGPRRHHRHAVLEGRLQRPVEHHVHAAEDARFVRSVEARQLAVLDGGHAAPHGDVEPALIEL